jgi:hypothetical protein
MALKFGVALHNARVSQIIVAVGASPKLRLYTGTAPTLITDSESGVLLAEITLPAVWLSAPVAGVATQVGAWSISSALATGIPGYFRIYDSAGSIAHIQGVVPTDMIGDPTELITIGTPVTIGPGYTFTDGNS